MQFMEITMMNMKNMLLGLVAMGVCSGAFSAVSSEVSDVINNDSKLNNAQKRAITQYAESLDSILNVDLQNREAIIKVNQDFMNAQQCLAMVYSADQQPYMMRVSRTVYEKTMSSDDKLKQYHLFLGQAQQEGDGALPANSAKACK